MSYWTHVNGAIRVDSTPLTNDEVKNLFKTCTFWGTTEEREACNVPRGSEGSLQVSVWVNPVKRDNRRFVITIFGDLRGFEESQHHEIIEWINAIITDNEMSVRDGVLTLNEKTYRYNEIYNDEWDVIFSGFELVHDYKEGAK